MRFVDTKSAMTRVVAAQEGEPTAPPDFESVFSAHQDRLVRVAGLLCGDRLQAEDAVADVFARVYRNWRPGRIVDIDAYLRRAVVNEVNSGFRRRVRARRRVANHASPAADAADRGLGERDRLWRAMGDLSGRQRAVLVLRYFEDLSEARVAQILDIPTGTVKSSAARGLERLRGLLREENDAD